MKIRPGRYVQRDGNIAKVKGIDCWGDDWTGDRHSPSGELLEENCLWHIRGAGFSTTRHDLVKRLPDAPKAKAATKRQAVYGVWIPVNCRLEARWLRDHLKGCISPSRKPVVRKSDR